MIKLVIKCFKKIQFYIAFATLLFIVNLILWISFGKKSTLILVGDNFFTNYSACIDTVYIREDNLNNKWYFRSYTSYSENTKKKFNNIIGTKTRYFEIADTRNVNEFSFNVFDVIPMYCEINCALLSGHESGEYKCYFIWFFGWHKIYGPPFFNTFKIPENIDEF